MEIWRKKEMAVRKKKLLCFFLSGFFLGVCYIVLLGHSKNSNLLMSSYFFSKYQYMEYSPLDLLGYILKSRLSILVFLWLMGLTAIGSMLVLLFGLWSGFSLGLILSMAVLKLGMAGILLCLISMFPHYLIYFPVFLFALLRIYETAQSKKPTAGYLLSFGVTVLLILAGAVLESYVNPLLLKGLIRKI